MVAAALTSGSFRSDTTARQGIASRVPQHDRGYRPTMQVVPRSQGPPSRRDSTVKVAAYSDLCAVWSSAGRRFARHFLGDAVEELVVGGTERGDSFSFECRCDGVKVDSQGGELGEDLFGVVDAGV